MVQIQEVQDPRLSASGSNVTLKPNEPKDTSKYQAGTKMTGAVSIELLEAATARWKLSEQGPSEECAVPDSPSKNDMNTASGIISTVPDPQTSRTVLSAHLNQCLAIFNLLSGIVYLNWRVFRAMNPASDWRAWEPIGRHFVDPDDPERAWSVAEELRVNWFCWLLFSAEVFVLIAIALSHASRCFPCKRKVCTMDDLIELDFELSTRSQVCVVLPARGESLTVLREVLLHNMSLHLWSGKLDVRRSLRLVIVDDRRRAELLLLTALCYRFASMFCNQRKVRGQLKLEAHGEMNLAEFYEYYQHCTASFGKTYSESFSDIFAVADMISKLCKDDCIPQEWDGENLPSGKRIEPQLVQTDLAKVPRLREDFGEIRSIMHVIYYSRPASEFSTSSPVASMINSLLFPEDPADVDILGKAQFLVVNNPRYVLQPAYLQRTVPYFYKANQQETGEVEYKLCPDIGFVQVALRYKDRKDSDPLANQELILNDVVSVGRDGVGGAFARRHACMYRVDVLTTGRNVHGQALMEEEKLKESIGCGVGFTTTTRCEALATAIEIFQRGYKSVYVNEIKEELATCIEEPQKLSQRIQELFDGFSSSVDLICSNPWLVVKASYATIWHRLFVLEELIQGFFMGLSVELLILCTALYCYLWRRPFFTHSIEVLFFFVPYYFSGALPTIIGLTWKRTKSDPAFRSFQLSFATAFVPLTAYLWGALSEMSRVVCSRTGRRQFVVGSCPSWPLYARVILMVASLAATFIAWAKAKFHHPGLWMTSCVVVVCVLGLLLPAAMRGVKYQGMSSFLFRYLALGIMLVVVAFWQQAGTQTLPHKMP